MPFFYRKSNTVLQKPPFSDSGLCRAVSKILRAQAAVLLPAPYLEAGGFFDVPPRIRISAEEFQLCLYVSMVPPAFTLLYMGNFKKLQVQKILAVADTEVFGKLLHLVIPDGIDPG